MALVTRSTDASMDVSTAQFAPQLTGLFAGEALDVAAPCYIKSADGKVYMTNATAANEAAEVVGFTPRAVALGQPVTLFGKGTRFHYGSGLTPGNILYSGATAGRLDDGATAGDAFGVAQVITATDIRITCDTTPLTSATLADGSIATAKYAPGSVDATALAADAVTTAKILNANVTQAKIATASLDGTVAKVVANANVIGGIPVIHRIAVAAGANGNVDVVLTHKTQIVNAWVVMTGAGTAGATLVCLNAGNAFTDTLAVDAAADAALVPFTKILDSQYEVAAGATVRVTKASTGGDFGGAIVYLMGIRVA